MASRKIRYGCLQLSLGSLLNAHSCQAASATSRLLDGLWALDLDRHVWALVAGEGVGSSGPAARSLHAMAVTSAGLLLVHGGLRKVENRFVLLISSLERHVDI